MIRRLLLIMTITIYSYGESRQPVPESETNSSLPVRIKTVRGVLSEANTALHMQGQVRAGYISFNDTGREKTNAYALGGHFHFYTDRKYGMMLAASAYTVLNVAIRQNPAHVNTDFFDANGKSFILLSKAFIDAQWRNTHIRLGRQALDTPMADSDDIRMIPNFFQSYTITNTDISNLTLSAGFIERMAGWENSVDASKFVNIGEVLGTEKIDGVYYAGMVYDAVEDLSLNLWYYHYDNIADVFYAEAGFKREITKAVDLTLGLQFAATRNVGKMLLGDKEGEAYGINLEVAFSQVGITVLTAYNRGDGENGATDLSLGGGPFFTSMEDQTIDAIGGKGSAWMVAIGYDFSSLNVSNLSGGIAYGSFKADRAIAGHYHTSETDIILDYQANDRLKLTAALAIVDHKDDGQQDFDQFRLIGNYSF